VDDERWFMVQWGGDKIGRNWASNGRRRVKLNAGA
jgi:hypothetical protein